MDRLPPSLVRAIRAAAADQPELSINDLTAMMGRTCLADTLPNEERRDKHTAGGHSASQENMVKSSKRTFKKKAKGQSKERYQRDTQVGDTSLGKEMITRLKQKGAGLSNRLPANDETRGRLTKDSTSPTKEELAKPQDVSGGNAKRSLIGEEDDPITLFSQNSAAEPRWHDDEAYPPLPSSSALPSKLLAEDDELQPHNAPWHRDTKQSDEPLNLFQDAITPTFHSPSLAAAASNTSSLDGSWTEILTSSPARYSTPPPFLPTWFDPDKPRIEDPKLWRDYMWQGLSSEAHRFGIAKPHEHTLPGGAMRPERLPGSAPVVSSPLASAKRKGKMRGVTDAGMVERLEWRRGRFAGAYRYLSNRMLGVRPSQIPTWVQWYRRDLGDEIVWSLISNTDVEKGNFEVHSRGSSESDEDEMTQFVREDEDEWVEVDELAVPIDRVCTKRGHYD